MRKAMRPIDRRFARRYTLLQCSYWPLSALASGFLAASMTNAGLRSSVTGMIICMALVAATLLQPYLSSVVDRSEKVTSRMIMLGIAGLIGLMNLIMWLLPDSQVVFAICAGVVCTLVNCVEPFLCSMSLDMMRSGILIDFSRSRGCGSLSYAATILILGKLIEKFGYSFTRWMTAAVAVFVLYQLWAFRAPRDMEQPEADVRAEKQQAQSTGAFLKSHISFVIIMCGVALFSGGQSIVGTFLHLVIDEVGGTSATQGLAMCFASGSEMPAMLLFMFLRRQRLSSGTIFRIASVFYVTKPLAMLLALALHSEWAVVFGMLTQGLSLGLYIPLIPYFVSVTIDRANQVKGQALLATASCMGSAASNLFGGAVCDLLGVRGSLLFSVFLTAAGSACIFIATAKQKKTGREMRIHY